jgi:hypothetical protein
MASSVSASVIPYITTNNAPRKPPSCPLATASNAAVLELFEIAASTLIFAIPIEGGIHR